MMSINEQNLGAGSLQIKKDIWFAVFYNTETKKYIWRTTKIKVPNVNPRTKTYKDAERAAWDLLPVIRDTLIKKVEQEEKKKNKSPEVTVIELIQDWISTSAKDEVRRSTYSTYKMYINKRIIPFFNEFYPDLPAIEITHQIMNRFAKHLRDADLKTSSIQKYLVPIRDAFYFGFEEEVISINPINDYKYSPKRKTLDEKESEKKGKRRALSKDEVFAMMAAIEKEITSPCVIPIVLSLRLGLRREEICGLRMSDINFEKECVTIKNTITNVVEVIEEENTKSVAGSRTIPIDKWTMKFLKLLKQIRTENKLNLGSEYEDNDYVYVRDDGKRYYPDTADKQLKKFLKRNRLNKITLHELRHSFCTIMIAAKKDLATVQYVMGHEDSRTTLEIYSHPIEENIFSASDAMEFFLAS